MAHILIVDDNASGAAIRARVLEMHGHHVQIALDGETAAKLAAHLLPEVVLLDHTLPGMSGRDLNTLLRELLPDVKVVSLSGYEGVGADYDPVPDAILVKGDGVKQFLETIADLTS